MADVFTIGYYPDKYIEPSGDTTGAADTALLNAMMLKKGTFILRDDGTYYINNTVTIDPTHVLLHGNGALINALHSGNAIKLDSTGSTNYKRAKARHIGEFTVRGNGNAASNGLLLDTPTGGDRSTSPSINNVCIENFGVGTRIGENSYLVTLRDVDIGWCATGIQRLNFANNGEQIKLDGGSIFNGGRAFDFKAPNGELRFFGTSLDYNKQIGYTDTIVEFHGVHFESNSANTTNKRQFEVDNGGSMTFIGGDCGLVDYNGGAINTALPPAPNLFTVWGQGGSYYDFGLKCNFAQHFTEKLCSVEGGYKSALLNNVSNTISKGQRGQVVPVTFGSTVTLDLYLSNFFNFTANSAFTLANPALVFGGQSGSIWITTTANAPMTLGSFWKGTGTLQANKKYRMDYVTVNATRIEYTINEVAA